MVENAISINAQSPKTGKRKLKLELIGISMEKDLALCQLSSEDIQLLLKDKTPQDLNMVFGDNLLVSETDEVMTIGYPLGHDRVKFTTGVVSGFYADIDDDDLLIENGDPSYIQITAAINRGNSGGSLLNKQGKVVGIIAAGYLLAQNVGYAIGSRTFLALYSSMNNIERMKDPNFNSTMKIVRLPHLSINWNDTNPDIFVDQGIYINEIFRDSIFKGIEEGDIINQIIYQDQRRSISAIFDNFGDLKLIDNNTNKEILNRRVNIKEFFDIIPLNSLITVIINRNGINYKLSTRYLPSDIFRIRFHYFLLEPLLYDIFAGICVSPFTLNHVFNIPKLQRFIQGKRKYKKHLLIVHKFPDTAVSKVNSLQIGDFIKSINNIKVKTIDDLRQLLPTIRGELLLIKTCDHKLFTVKLQQTIKEDQSILKTFGITNYKYLLS